MPNPVTMIVARIEYVLTIIYADPLAPPIAKTDARNRFDIMCASNDHYNTAAEAHDFCDRLLQGYAYQAKSESEATPAPVLPAQVVSAEAESGAAGLRDLLVALGQGQSHGIRSIPAYARARLELKNRFAVLGIPFFAPEGYGTQAFHMRYLALLETLGNIDERQQAKPPHRQRDVSTPCTSPNADAAITGAPAQPVYPNSARELGATGVSQIKVTLDSHGTVTDASVYKSAGNPDLDKAAVLAATETKYTPEIVNCHGAAGSYVFRAEFTGQ